MPHDIPSSVFLDIIAAINREHKPPNITAVTKVLEANE